MIKKIKASFMALSKFEVKLYIVSLSAVLLSYIFSMGNGFFQAIASALGVTALIFIAKGDVLGQILTVVFSILYGIISYQMKYYGEMITYMFMTAPMAVLAVISWLRNPYKKNKSEVKVYILKKHEIILMFLYSAIVTFVFYYILKAFGTVNLIPGTISVTTSFLASYLTYKRSQFYAIGYAANDVVLIVLWVMAALKDISHLPMVFCFIMFLINDLYGYLCWNKMKKRQCKE